MLRPCSPICLFVLLWTGCAPPTLTPADYRDRLPALEARIAQAPTDADAFRDLGEAYAQLQRFREAERVLTRAYEIDSDDPQTLYYLGVAHEGAGSEAEALFVLGQYGRVSPDSPYRSLMEARHTWLRRAVARRELQALLVMEDEAAAARASDAVAVFPFIYRGSDPRFEVLGRGLGEMLTVDLASVDALTVVERVRLQALLQELEFAQGDGFDPQTAPRIGRLLQSSRVVGGSFDVRGERLETDVVLWEWRDEPLPALSEHDDTLDALFRLQNEIAFGLIDELGISLSPAERDRIEQIPTRDLQAFLAFSRGLWEEDAGDFAAAAAQFQQAARLDPGFSLAGQRAGAARALSNTAGPISAALDGGKTATGAGAGGSQSSMMSDLVGARLSTLNQNIGAHVVPSEETRSAETPFEPPAIEPIPDPPPPPPVDN
jgi:TolB-like protein